MRGFPGIAILTAVMIAAAVGAADAQCSFQHPQKATHYQTSLVQAFLGCAVGVNSCCATANGSTEGGVPSCAPPESFNELSGNPPDGWQWSPKAEGGVSLKVKGSDVAIALALKGIVDVNGPATGTGSLFLLLRATLRDPMNGTMTMVDLPVGVPAPVSGGKASVKTTLRAALEAPPLNGIYSPDPCTSFEIVSVAVIDGNGDTFATAGVFLPPV